jgi:F-type H+-transporting ATPase subunit delta
MSDESTIARPYARGLFRHALEAHQLAEWLTMLNTLSAILQDPKVVMIIKNPSISAGEKSQFICSLFDDKTVTLKNFIQLLAENKRLLIVSAILNQFSALKNNLEKSLPVIIKSCSPLRKEQEERLKAALKNKFHREILLSSIIDPTLLGGAVIYAGDRVIDGSLVRQLQKLKEGLSHV